MNDVAARGYSLQELATMIFNYADGAPSQQAAAGLLVFHETWVTRADFTTRFVTVHHDGLSGLAEVDYAAAIRALDDGELPCSGSEANILRIAASLATGTPVSLGRCLGGLDFRNTRLVLEAIAEANGYPNAQVHLR